MNSVGIDISKGRSTVAVMRPFGEVVISPFEVRHTDSELSELARRLKSLDGETRLVMAPSETTICRWQSCTTTQDCMFPLSMQSWCMATETTICGGSRQIKKMLSSWQTTVLIAGLLLSRYIPEEDTQLLLKNCYRQYR